MVNIGKLTIPTDFHVIRPTEGDKGGRPQVLLGRPFLKTARFKLQYDDDTFSLSVGKITEIFHVTRPPAPWKKGAHQLRVGSKKIEPEKLLRSEERKESENPKNDAFIEKGLRIAPPQLKKKRKKLSQAFGQIEDFQENPSPPQEVLTPRRHYPCLGVAEPQGLFSLIQHPTPRRDARRLGVDEAARKRTLHQGLNA
ncbi:hypothetical protein PIB30_079806 [Stylosanthes scabra]|uniref:Uncharacterized protein n=1 Tax=Stylosanthes scabra TaxID=79078 RepID=A0ABU6XT09_9FABA|nr:hypothetical protein [Stylosanthes scabra]